MVGNFARNIFKKFQQFVFGCWYFLTLGCTGFRKTSVLDNLQAKAESCKKQYGGNKSHFFLFSDLFAIKKTPLFSEEKLFDSCFSVLLLFFFCFCVNKKTCLHGGHLGLRPGWPPLLS